MDMKLQEHIVNKTQIGRHQIASTLRLLEEGCTVPFIARYRKEVTGGLDELQIIAIRDAGEQYRELTARKESILSSLKERELLTPELEQAVLQAETLTLLEDIYLPYKPKKRTKGMIAKEAGLEPLALWISTKSFSTESVTILHVGKEAVRYLNEEAGIRTTDDALNGAKDILAEQFNEDKEVRQELREFFSAYGIISSKPAPGMRESRDAQKFKDYFGWEELASKAPSHRILAILRGTDEGYLISHFRPEESEALLRISRRVLKNADVKHNAAAEVLEQAMIEGYRRLTAPSLENALRKECKERADKEAIKVFSDNVRELLLAPPLGEKRIMGVDPGLRTGCKVVCLDQKGDLLSHDAIYPLVPHNKVAEASRLISSWCKLYQVEAIAVGNGTGGREAESFLRGVTRELKKSLGRDIPVIMVNESGASVYSASQAARDEFPDKDVTVRGAVSIARRLMDPLAELVKIDPKAIGVGQYQHDVNQSQLADSLADVVRSCVNSVGVEINTASAQLLQYVSGITLRTAVAIRKYREFSGPFTSREQLLDVPGIGPKSYEQAAGFLRIRGAENPLDASGVHPESYPIVMQMASDLGCSIKELINNKQLISRIRIKQYTTDSIGLPTLKDIIEELEKPGRDPREHFSYVSFSDEVHQISDLSVGMRLPGVVTNVTAFGAFVDIGVHQDGLVHISKLADHYVKDPNDVVKVNQQVTVTVTDVDHDRRRISLSMREED